MAFPIGLMCYVTAVAGQTIGDKVTVGWDVPCKIGNALPLLKIPLNVKICCIEAVAGSGAVYARAPGN
ncbi:MAG TPA: hypothetical protein PKD85_00110 [Saprospiraceae bacterium]|nr:hypothetical protein [Saprospiraceae bacterium]